MSRGPARLMPPDVLRALAARALRELHDGDVVGLGTGRAATAFIKALGASVRAGLRVRGVPTSSASERLARSLGIALTTLDRHPRIDVDVDGADEVDPGLRLIKGYGGALVREKVVASASRRLIILITPEKRVPYLGRRGTLPVEVLPFAAGLVEARLDERGIAVRKRRGGATDNGNLILDCEVSRRGDARRAHDLVSAIPGVLGTGLFLRPADLVLVGQGPDQVEVLRP